MPANYVLLEKITVGAAGASSVTFSSIPQTGYTDLVIKWSARSNRSAVTDPMRIGFNGSTSSFTNKYLSGNSSSAISGSSARYLGEASGNTATASTFANGEIVIPNYAGSNNKSASSDNVSENNSGGSGDAVATFAATLWSNSAAITSVELTLDTGPLFMQHSTFYLYGVAALGTTPAIVPYATGGDTIMTDGTYWYHTFISSGTFTPQKALSVDYLVVAGGGGGGNAGGGGGGAGGFRTDTSFSVASGLGITVTVGAGGSGASNVLGTVRGTNGVDSVFDTITATGGGAGGCSQGAPVQAGLAGGSGGGGSNGGAGGAASPSGQGNAGGNGEGSVAGSGGGGGGSNAAGTNANSSTGDAGNGGDGTSNSYSGSAVIYAGGGGGGAQFTKVAGIGGTGGAGDGTNNNTAGANGADNRGSGGGGNGDTNGAPNFAAGGNGGSGIVLVRYAV